MVIELNWIDKINDKEWMNEWMNKEKSRKEFMDMKYGLLVLYNLVKMDVFVGMCMCSGFLICFFVRLNDLGMFV